MPEKSPTGKAVSLKIKPDPEMEPRRIYSNYASIDHSGFDFTIRFCDACPPYGIDLEKSKDKEIEHRVPIVAEIAIPHQMVPGLIGALKSQYELFQKTYGHVIEKKEASNGKKKQ